MKRQTIFYVFLGIVALGVFIWYIVTDLQVERAKDSNSSPYQSSENDNG